MFDHKPTEEEIAKWFAGFKLHEGLDHAQYVGGIVAIENRDRGQSLWMLYINATARIAYFWDWIDKNGYVADINVTGPFEMEIELPDEKKSRQFYMAAEITVVKPEENDGQTIVRRVSGRKQVDKVVFRRGYNGQPGRILPDSNALMKAETGAIARALGTIGMLALPGSGLATAEDMVEFLGVPEPSAEQTQAAAPAAPVHSKERVQRQTKAVPNPKK
jgi:hypothetical protein